MHQLECGRAQISNRMLLIIFFLCSSKIALVCFSTILHLQIFMKRICIKWFVALNKHLKVQQRLSEGRKCTRTKPNKKKRISVIYKKWKQFLVSLDCSKIRNIHSLEELQYCFQNLDIYLKLHKFKNACYKFSIRHDNKNKTKNIFVLSST